MLVDHYFAVMLWIVVAGLVLFVAALVATVVEIWFANKKEKQLKHYIWLRDLGLHETGFLLYHDHDRHPYQLIGFARPLWPGAED